MSYTEEELNLLSDEERAAIAEGQSEAAEAVEEVQENTEANAETTEEAPAVEAVAETETTGERDDVFIPQYAVNPVADFQEKMALLVEQKAALRVKLNEGDIALDEYEAQKDALIEQERTLHEQKLKADIAAERNEQVSQARWDWEQERFFDAKENAIYSDKYLHAALNAAVIDLANNPENADKKGSWVLQEADKLVRSRFGMTKPEQPAALKKDEPRKPDLSVVPKTLAHLPAADIQQTGDVGEFDHLDRLTGLELEKAVSRLSESERERYRAA